jgi:hypothetical protein
MAVAYCCKEVIGCGARLCIEVAALSFWKKFFLVGFEHRSAGQLNCLRRRLRVEQEG